MLCTTMRIRAAAAGGRATTAAPPCCARLPAPAPARAALVVAARAAAAPPPALGRARRARAPANNNNKPSTTTGRTLRLSVVAYREHRDIDRERTICSLGDRVVHSLMHALTRPASAAALGPEDACVLRGDTAASGLEVRIDGVLDSESFSGQDALMAWIERERKDAQAMLPGSSWSLVASAACPLDDAYFSLVETVHEREAGPDGKARDPLVLHKIIWFDVELDDTKRQVTGVHMRSQLAPEDLGGLVSVDSAHRALSATPFPHDRVKAYPPGLNVDVPLNNQRRWCEARCSRNDERAMLFGGADPALDGPAIDRQKYRLWDAFGVLPVLCDPSKRALPDACVVPGEAVADIIRGAKERFTIDCRLQDAAVSFEKTIAFTRWLSLCEDRRSGEKFRLEGLEAVVFDERGLLTDTWLFRDPTPSERARLTGE